MKNEKDKKSKKMNPDTTIPTEMNFIRQLVQYRISMLQRDQQSEPIFPQPETWDLNLHPFAMQYSLSSEEIILIWIALTAHVRADLYDEAIHEVLRNSGDLPAMGGVRGKNFRGFLPTGETALFLLAGDNLNQRFRIAKLFESDHLFAKNRIMWLEDVPAGEPLMCGRIILSREYVELFTTGKITKPHLSSSFPARLIQTELDWDQLVLADDVMKQIKQL
jgi:hypothetical protein